MTNETNTPDGGPVNQDVQETRAPHLMTIVIDLSGPTFSDRKRAALNIARILSSMCEGLMFGSEDAVAKDNFGNNCAVFRITQDKTGTARELFGRLVGEVDAIAAHPDTQTLGIEA